MGTHMRVVVGAPGARRPAVGGRPPTRSSRSSRTTTRASRAFAPDSELSRLNADPRAIVPASQLLRDAVARRALGRRAHTDGLVDPTVLDDARGRRLPRVLGHAPRAWTCARRSRDAGAPRAARPHARDRRWQLDRRSTTTPARSRARRACGSTPAAPARATPPTCAAELLAGYDAWAVDCGGDLRIGGDAGVVRDVEVEHPFTGETLDTRPRPRRRRRHVRPALAHLARRGRRRSAHHLLDPSTGEPAFTGLVAVTALAPTAVEAEALAKAALLSGPAGARSSSPAHGGLTVAEDGTSSASAGSSPRRACASALPVADRRPRSAA